MSAGEIQVARAKKALSEEVLRLANIGFCLFPCRPGDKRPAINQWPDRATDDAAQIEAWIQEFPNCNWGIAVWKSGFFAVDVDRKRPPANGAAQDGFETLAAWCAEHGETPDWLQ